MRMLKNKRFFIDVAIGDGEGAASVVGRARSPRRDRAPRRRSIRHLIDRRRRSGAVDERHRRWRAMGGRGDAGLVRSG
jgi:hypothetical protein